MNVFARRRSVRLSPLQVIEGGIAWLENLKAALESELSEAEEEERQARARVELIDGYFDDCWGFFYAPSKCCRPDIGLYVSIHGGDAKTRHQRWEDVQEEACAQLRAASKRLQDARSMRYRHMLQIEYELAEFYYIRRLQVAELRRDQARLDAFQIDPSQITFYL